MDRMHQRYQNLIVEQPNCKAKYLQNGEETDKKVELSHFSSFNIMSYFIYTDLILV